MRISVFDLDERRNNMIFVLRANHTNSQGCSEDGSVPSTLRVIRITMSDVVSVDGLTPLRAI